MLWVIELNYHIINNENKWKPNKLPKFKLINQYEMKFIYNHKLTLFIPVI